MKKAMHVLYLHNENLVWIVWLITSLTTDRCELYCPPISLGHSHSLLIFLPATRPLASVPEHVLIRNSHGNVFPSAIY